MHFLVDVNRPCIYNSIMNEVQLVVHCAVVFRLRVGSSVARSISARQILHVPTRPSIHPAMLNPMVFYMQLYLIQFLH